MKPTLAAARALEGVIDRGIDLDAAMRQAVGGAGEIPAQMKEISYGGCRQYIFLDALIGAMLKKPLRKNARIVHFILVAALYQIENTRRPDHAVVNEAVDAVKQTDQAWAIKLVNGVLRNWLRNGEKISAGVAAEHLRYAFPQDLLDRIRSDWPDYYRQIAKASNQKPPLTLRINLSKTNRQDYAALLDQEGIGFSLCSDSEIGLTISDPIPVSRIPGFGQGLVSVQDESAQLVSYCLPAKVGLRVLDGCASPGGKTCLLLERNPAPELLVAVDRPKRTGMIRENLQRLELDAEVIAADLTDTGSWWDGKMFDQVLLDVPCSGSGVIRRHPDIKHRRKRGDVEKFTLQQGNMLNVAWSVLKPGGLLLYTTCSILKAENDDVIKTFLHGRGNFELQLPGDVPAVGTEYGRQRLPGVHSGDGFYYCCITKKHDSSTEP